MPIINSSLFGSGGTDTGDATATAPDILRGKTAYGASGKLTGTMPMVEAATPSISVNSSGLITATTIQNTGYVASETKSATQQLATQAGRTIIPGTTQQTAVASGRYTTQAVYVDGSPNLIASNIKSGVNIFGITGTLSSNQFDWKGRIISSTRAESNKKLVFQTGSEGFNGSKPYGFAVDSVYPTPAGSSRIVIGYSVFFPPNALSITGCGIELICSVFSSSGITSTGFCWDVRSSTKGPIYADISINESTTSITLQSVYVWDTSIWYSLSLLFAD